MFYSDSLFSFSLLLTIFHSSFEVRLAISDFGLAIFFVNHRRDLNRNLVSGSCRLTECGGRGHVGHVSDVGHVGNIGNVGHGDGNKNHADADADVDVDVDHDGRQNSIDNRQQHQIL